MDINNIFIQKYFLFSALFLIAYTLVRVVYDKTDDFKAKALKIFLILVLPVLGSIVYLVSEIRRVKKIKDKSD